MKNTSSLRKLQADFAAWVFDDADNGFDREIAVAGLAGDRRLQIYHNNVYTSLSAALKAVYPVIERLTGEDFFNYMAKQYIRWYPSVSGNLHDFGSRFAVFVSEFEPAKELVYLPDVARLEWAYHSVFHAAESAYLDVTKLYAVAENEYEKLRFSLNPASRLIKSDYPVLSIWRVNQEGSDEEAVDLDVGGSNVLVIRRNMDIDFQPLSDGEFAFLYSLSQGDEFARACELALYEEPGCAVDSFFQAHVHAKTLTGFSV